jgi:AraC-like DNA-binding protein/mannose-6-phosphate isomerase-like protein (cupin superfamily)
MSCLGKTPAALVSVRYDAGMRKTEREEWQKGPGFYDETYERQRILLPELPVFGYVKVRRARPGSLRPDRHEGEYELHVMLRGRLRFVVGGRRFEVTANTAFLTWPGELHWAEDMTLPTGAWYRLRFRPPPDAGCGLKRAEWRGLRKSLEDLPARQFPASPELKDVLRRILEEHRRVDAHRSTMLRALFLELLLLLVRGSHHRAAPGGRRTVLPSARMLDAMRYIDGRVTQVFSIEEVARHVGLSPRQFREQFRREVGFPPVEYLERQRVEAAKRLLVEPDATVKGIAFALGFGGSSYFAAVFKRFTGKTPRQFRARTLLPTGHKKAEAGVGQQDMP